MKLALAASVLALAWTTAEAGVTVERMEGSGFIARATLEGRVIDWAAPRVGSGRRAVVLLIEPLEEHAEQPAAAVLLPCPAEAAARPLVLARLDLAPEPTLERIRADLPGDVTAVEALALDAGEEDAWIALESGRVLRLAPSGTLEELSEGVGLLPADAARGSRLSYLWAADAGSPAFFAHDTHLARLFRAREGKLVPTSVEIPAQARLAGGEIVLTAPQWSWIGAGPEGSTWVAARPEPVGRQRLRVPLVLADRDGATRAIESWLHLPEPEDLLAFSFERLDGAPVVVVETKAAGKLGLMAEKRLRLYRLREDRTRLGLEPAFAVVTGMNLWQASTIFFRDVTGDGRDDLVVGYWKGLGDDKVVLDVYRRLGDDAFEDKARTTAFDVKDGDRSFVGYGTDFDGDGLADLLVRSEGKLLLHRGRRSETGARLVEHDALAFEAPAATGEVTVTLAVGGGRVWAESSALASGPASADLDADGVPEILAVDRGDATRAGSITIVRPPRAE